MIHVLGIDAGGTKTVCHLADEHGTLVAEARAGGANLQAAGELQVEKVLHDVMAEAIGDAGSCRRRSASGLPASIGRKTRSSSAASCAASVRTRARSSSTMRSSRSRPARPARRAS